MSSADGVWVLLRIAEWFRKTCCNGNKFYRSLLADGLRLILAFCVVSSNVGGEAVGAGLAVTGGHRASKGQQDLDAPSLAGADVSGCLGTIMPHQAHLDGAAGSIGCDKSHNDCVHLSGT